MSALQAWHAVAFLAYKFWSLWAGACGVWTWEWLCVCVHIHHSKHVSFFKYAVLCHILVFEVTACGKRHLQTTVSQSSWLPSQIPGLRHVFEKACCLKTSISFSLNRLQTRLYSVFSLFSPSLYLISHFSTSFTHISSLCLFKASNGNDPWSVWNADPSGGSNNWASNPEGTQTEKSAADPWGSVSHGHPQAYQGPGKSSFSVGNHGWCWKRMC